VGRREKKGKEGEEREGGRRGGEGEEKEKGRRKK
jgi:hypothetical protein